jgi:TonB family protein
MTERPPLYARSNLAFILMTALAGYMAVKLSNVEAQISQILRTPSVGNSQGSSEPLANPTSIPEPQMPDKPPPSNKPASKEGSVQRPTAPRHRRALPAHHDDEAPADPVCPEPALKAPDVPPLVDPPPNRAPEPVAPQLLTYGAPKPVGIPRPVLVPIYKPAPPYPRLARDARIWGLVRLIAWISRDGSVSEVKVIKGNPILAKAAKDQVMQWRYQSFEAPTEELAPLEITVDFQLP